MEGVIRLLESLKAATAISSEQIAEITQHCRQGGIPCITLYSPIPGDSEWYEMHRAYVLTKRTDAHEHIWYLSSHYGLIVIDRNDQEQVPFEQWDPEAYLFTDESLFDGITNVDPFERD